MTDFVGRVYNDIAEDSLEELRDDIGDRATEKYTVSISTDTNYD